MYNIVKYGLILVLTMFVSATAIASEQERQAEEFVSSIGVSVMSSLSDTGLTADDRKSMLQKMLIEKFDLEKIGRFVLGSYRNDPTKVQMDEFTKVFQSYVIALYTTQFKYYSGEEFIIRRSMNRNKNGVILVYADIVSPGKTTLNLAFRVITKEREFRVVDVGIQGISMLITLRSDFTGFLSQHDGDIDKLINELTRKVNMVSRRKQ